MPPIEFEGSRRGEVIFKGKVPEEKGTHQVGESESLTEIIRFRKDGRGPNGEWKAFEARFPGISRHSKWFKFNGHKEVTVDFPQEVKITAKRAKR